jgi:hypothetical protein
VGPFAVLLLFSFQGSFQFGKCQTARPNVRDELAILTRLQVAVNNLFAINLVFSKGFLNSLSLVSAPRQDRGKLLDTASLVNKDFNRI